MCVALAAQSTANLFVNGNLASSSVVEIKGAAYVPLRDVAKAMNMTLQKTSRGWELAAAGGANAVQGLEGKVGDTLWDGRHRFQVIEVIRGKKYVNRFSGNKMEVTPYPESKELVVVVCRIKNGLNKTVTIGFPGGALTALTDTDEHAFQPRDGLSMDTPGRGIDTLPGAAVDFALTFDVPEKSVLKDLVYQAADYSGLGETKPFRVSLK